MPNQTDVAVILAGGKGSRLKPLISDVPKPLANIAGKPFLFLLLEMLAASGIKKVVLLTSYMHEKIKVACQDGEAFGLEILYSEEKEPLGTAGALRHAKHLLNSHENFILMNGDTYLDCSIESMLTHSLTHGILGIISLCQPEEIARFGSVQLGENNIIEAFREKDTQSTGFVNAGIYKLSREILKLIPENQFCSLETDIFPTLVRKKALLGLPLEGLFYDIGTPESYTAFHLKQTQNI